jgi:very-short-patch-repair endonuclease
MPGTVEARIAALAARQHGVVTRSQLVACGFTPDVVCWRLKTQRLREVHRGVYGVGPLALPREPEMAAALACGPRAVASHEHAAGLWELRAPPSSGSAVHVRVPEAVRIRRRGIRVHRTRRLEADDVAVVDGIPVTSVPLTILDLAALLSGRDLERVVARAERARLVTTAELGVFVEGRRGLRGAATLARLLAQPGTCVFTRSEFEERFRDELRRFGLSIPRFNPWVRGYELDCYWPDAWLAVELDGAAYHAAWRNQERDRLRDADLAAAGITVIRVSWRQLTEETGRTMVRIAQALAVGRERMARAGGR